MRFLAACLLILPPLSALAAEEQARATISDKTAAMQPMHGYFDLYWDAAAGKVYLEIDAFDAEFLYVTYLSSGLGSNDVGLDRGQIGSTQVVYFHRVGPKVLLIEPNYTYRALSDNPDEVADVDQAFAKSVLWGFEVTAEENGRVLVDATPFFLRDAHGVVRTLKRTDQGSFSLDASRSAINLERTRNFPLNTEVDAWLTFAGDSPGGFVRDVTPDPTAVTVAEHHSLIQLPDDQYTPRAFDPRAGSFSISFYDYATPFDQPLQKRWVARHRLRKKNPEADVSEPVEPIVYYLDRGTPEPIRSALLEGARWWNQAFEAIGYKDAFRVEMLPEDADPLDIRYNVIQWVHRATRGWSYGDAVIDPRTGEIIKGHVTLGSLRVRQDFLIAQGLTTPFVNGDEDPTAAKAMALARLRQLAAHEVGHTLGFEHNFAASTNGRASVMDYPPPLISLNDNGQVDLSAAYDTGIGEWDKVAVAYAYQDFPEGADESAQLHAILAKAESQGLRFISDQDARPPGGAHPYAHLWDTGADPAKELNRILDVRQAALDNFSEAAIRTGRPMAYLEEVLVPIYLLHRYQAEAAVKLVGGIYYTYEVREGRPDPVLPVGPDMQREALDALFRAINPRTLTLPERILKLVPPRANGMDRHRETFDIRTGVTLDPVSMAEAAADDVIGLLLHPARATRLVEQHARDPELPGLQDVLQRLLYETWKQEAGEGLMGQVHRSINDVVLRRLMQLAQADQATPMVRAHATEVIRDLDVYLLNAKPGFRPMSADTEAQFRDAANRIQRFQERPESFSFRYWPESPPGSPIGSTDDLAYDFLGN